MNTKVFVIQQPTQTGIRDWTNTLKIVQKKNKKNKKYVCVTQYKEIQELLAVTT